MELERLIAALAPSEVVGRRDVEVLDLAYDARAAIPGALFFCVPGARFDGHEFAAAAVANGARGLVVERALEIAVPQLVVADARAAMAVAADVFFGQPTVALEVAGVTGTNGKTTTAFLAYAILEAAGRRPGLLGTIESRVGGGVRPVVRTTPGRSTSSARSASCSTPATAASCSRRLRTPPSSTGSTVCASTLVFTNSGHDHLDFHATMEDYYGAKRRLFVGAAPPPAAVNVGDPYGRLLADELRTAAGRP